uniref:Uncharacterized protein n=1 Tax=Arundo donax TaxID=35708 RepID=A0A0A9D0W5_ARUDO
MRTIISPSRAIQEAVHWALKGANPDIVLHMCMMMNRYVALYCMCLHKLKVAIVMVQAHFFLKGKQGNTILTSQEFTCVLIWFI